MTEGGLTYAMGAGYRVVCFAFICLYLAFFVMSDSFIDHVEEQYGLAGIEPVVSISLFVLGVLGIFYCFIMFSKFLRVEIHGEGLRVVFLFLTVEFMWDGLVRGEIKNTLFGGRFLKLTPYSREDEGACRIIANVPLCYLNDPEAVVLSINQHIEKFQKRLSEIERVRLEKLKRLR